MSSTLKLVVATRLVSRISSGRWINAAPTTITTLKGLTQIRHFSATRSLYFHQTLLRLARKNIVVPPLAESLSEGDIKYEKSVGDVVSEDELLANVETDKTSIPINSPIAGKIVELTVEDSSTVKPGQTIMVIDSDGSSAAAAPPTKSDDAPKESHTTQSSPPPPPPPQPTPPKPARHETSQAPPPPPPQQNAFAQQKSSIPVDKVKSDLAELSKGQFASNISSALEQRTVSAVKMNRMRQRIASRLKDAQNTYAMLTTFNEIDMSNLMEMRQRYKDVFLKKHSVKLGFMSAFVKASAFALREQPIVNAVIEENQILYRDYVDISVAVATPKGLVVPVLRNVENMSFADIEKNIGLLGEKARDNALTVADMEGGTFTISNGGVFGSLFGTPIINMPQSAILGMHAIKEKPVAVNGQVVIRPVMVVALTYDHRLIDGREAVTFLKKIADVIEDPRIILLDL